VSGRTFSVRAGWNRIRLGLRGVRQLRVRMAAVRVPPGGTDDGGGLFELRVPGLRVSEALRVPVLAERALAGRDLRRSELVYVLSRTTGDDPLHRERLHGPAQARAVRDRGDGEAALRRIVSPPAARSYEIDAWTSLSPLAADDAVDRLAGTRGPLVATSSSRYRNVAAFRASGAFDRSSARAWVGQSLPGQPAWISWRTQRPLTVRRLRLRPPVMRVPTPATVRLTAGGVSTPALAVRAGGEVVLPGPLRGREFRLEVLATRPPPRATPGERAVTAVAIGELAAAGLPRLEVPPGGALRAPCGTAVLRVGGRRVPLRVHGDVAALDGARPLRALACGGRVHLLAGPQLVVAPDGVLRVDHLRLRSAAPAATPPPAGGGRVLDSGDPGRAGWDGVRVAAAGPAWLVLGQSFDRGWRAYCNGRDLGEPRVIDAFANGWRVERGCREVRFAYVPQRPVVWAYAASALAALALLALLLLRRPRPREAVTPAPLAAPERPAPWPLPRAVAAGLVVGAVLGFVFALRAGAVIAPATTLVLWRGIGPRALVLAAAGLLGVVVPALYLLFPANDRGGFNFEYAVDQMGAHWVAVGALALLGLALARSVWEQRRAGPPSTASRASPAREREARAAAPGPA
jgi:arabinofuranan 3-O-arabinosyltransferase